MKRMLAMLLCLAMLLSFVPATIFSTSADSVIPEDGDISVEITPDDEVEETTEAPDPETSAPESEPENTDRVAYCAACGAEVTWTPVTGRINSNNGTHFYLTEDLTYVNTLPVVSAEAGATVCVDLNGHDITTASELNVKGILNIQGEGAVGGSIGTGAFGNGGKEDVDFDDLVNAGQGNTVTYDAALINIAAADAVVNIYGGTYSVANDKPIVAFTEAGKLNVLGGEIAGTVNAGDLTLGGAAKITLIETANLTVKADWTGTAVIADAVLGGVAEGDFTGSLTTVDGKNVVNVDGVLAIEVPAVLTGITVTAPTKVEYELGEELALDGMIVTGVYSNETTAPIAEGFTVTGFDSETAGVKTVTVTFEGFTATFEVTVKEAAAVITGIEVTTLPTKTTYMAGASFDAKGMVVTATYSDGTTAAITEYTVDVDLATAGTKTVTITSGELTTTFTVEVIDNVTITATVANAAKGIAVSWTNVGAESYVIYERHLVDGVMTEWAQLKSQTNANYTHTGAAEGVTYQYKIEAKIAGLVVGEVETAEIARVAAATVTVINDMNGVLLTWEENAAADAYYVYRRAYPDGVAGEWEKVAEVTEAGYLDTKVTNGMKYGYTVRALSGSDLSVESTEVTVLRLDTIIVNTENTPGGIKLTWKANTAVEEVKYFIYRAEYKDGQWTEKRLITLFTIGYTDLTATNGVLYRYRVTAVKGSQTSATITGTEQLRLTLPALTAVNQAKGIQLTWKANSAAEKYELYRSSYNETTKAWTSWGKPILETSELTYLDQTAENGIKYRYTVRAVNGAYKSGYKDSAVLVRLERPVITSIISTANSITVSWETNEAAAKYAVYRSELVDGKWSSWTRLTYVQKPNTSYNDLNVVTGTTYRYRVTTVKSVDESLAVISRQTVRIPNTSISLSVYTGRIGILIKPNAYAFGYSVERRVVIDKDNKVYGEWETVVTDIVASTTNITVYDETPESGVTYEYRAVAHRGEDNGYGKANSITAK